jgi:hypothetical protein
MQQGLSVRARTCGQRGPIDLGPPVCMALASVLHFLTADQAGAAAVAFKKAIMPGSYLIV